MSRKDAAPLPIDLAKKQLEIARNHIDFMAEQLEKGAIITIEFVEKKNCERISFIKNDPRLVARFFGPKELSVKQILRRKYRKEKDDAERED